MRTNFNFPYIILCGLIIFIFFGSCSKDNTPLPTTLQITLLDTLGNPLSGASVKLYSTSLDLFTGINQTGATLTSDATGKVSFNVTYNKTYYWLAAKGCVTSWFASTYFSDDCLTATIKKVNGINPASTTLRATGMLYFTNNSTEDYEVDVYDHHGDIYLEALVDGNTSAYFWAAPANYSINIKNLNTGITDPTTYKRVLQCSDTLKFIFPN